MRRVFAAERDALFAAGGKRVDFELVDSWQIWIRNGSVERGGGSRLLLSDNIMRVNTTRRLSSMEIKIFLLCVLSNSRRFRLVY